MPALASSVEPETPGRKTTRGVKRTRQSSPVGLSEDYIIDGEICVECVGQLHQPEYVECDIVRGTDQSSRCREKHTACRKCPNTLAAYVCKVRAHRDVDPRLVDRKAYDNVNILYAAFRDQIATVIDESKGTGKEGYWGKASKRTAVEVGEEQVSLLRTIVEQNNKIIELLSSGPGTSESVNLRNYLQQCESATR